MHPWFQGIAVPRILAHRGLVTPSDAADGIVFAMKHHSDEEIVNLGSGKEVSIRDLAGLIGQVVGFSGRLTFDSSKPDGTPRKVMDVSRLRELGWEANTPLVEGLRQTYEWYVEHVAPEHERMLARA